MLYGKEQKGPVSALTQVNGYLVSAIGQKVCLTSVSHAPTFHRGVARIFQRGAGGGWGGHTGSNNIAMAFSPRNVVGCLLKKRLTKGGGVTGTPGPP